MSINFKNKMFFYGIFALILFILYFAFLPRILESHQAKYYFARFKNGDRLTAPLSDYRVRNGYAILVNKSLGRSLIAKDDSELVIQVITEVVVQLEHDKLSGIVEKLDVSECDVYRTFEEEKWYLIDIDNVATITFKADQPYDAVNWTEICHILEKVN